MAHTHDTVCGGDIQAKPAAHVTGPKLDERTMVVIAQYQMGLIGLPDLIDKLTDRLDELRGGHNMWGTRRSDINPAEYCRECEHTTGGHYDMCPTNNSRNSGTK